MMSVTEYNLPPTHSALSRERYLQIVQASLKAYNYRFARQAVLAWLASYPGDLTAGFYYAQSLLGERRLPQALVVLEGLCRADPEFEEAAETWQASLGESGDAALPTYLYALTGRSNRMNTLDEWGSHLWNARQALKLGDLDTVEGLVRQALSMEPPTPLAWVTHLQFLDARRSIPVQTRHDLAQRYYQRWPDCLACMLFLAEWSMELGDSATAVALLHQAAARDVEGQVVKRLWGAEHPYRSLWPARLELVLNLPVPVEVSAVLGWNRLPQGEPSIMPVLGADPDAQVFNVPSPQEQAPSSAPLWQGADSIEEVQVVYLEADTDSLTEPPALESTQSFTLASEAEQLVQPTVVRKEALDAQANAEELKQVEASLRRLAERLNVPGLMDLDGRYPVYVIFSVHSRLEEVYGSKIAAILEAEMGRLVQIVQSQRGWGARLFLADTPGSATPLGIQPARPGDPWSLKLALADLDIALAKRGEMIGAVLIVGGPEIVPFHHLPNPVDDLDADVPSDNPYGTRDENYFIPEWPVGRLPGGADGDARLLLGALRRVCNQHLAQGQDLAWYRRWLRGLTDWLRLGEGRGSSNFGYTAAVWKKAAQAVFRPIGEPTAVLVSPPWGIDGNNPEAGSADPANNPGGNGASQPRVPSPAGRLGYFNLHGLADAPEWYGQRDPFDLGDGPDYPVALRPQDILPDRRNGKPGVPQVVFSEACYGLHVQDKTVDEAMSLKFLETGSLVVAGSTCMAYGSIGTPLIAADLLGHSFWRYTQEGMPAGEALRQAKVALADEMVRRQDYLDGEDQKTLISFILFGDPLARPAAYRTNAKGRYASRIHRLARTTQELKTICDRAGSSSAPLPVPAEVLACVRKAVAQYLPGMEDAQVALTEERQECCGEGHACPTSQLGHKGLAEEGELRGKEKLPGRKTARRLVMLSKQIPSPEGLHPQYARLTLDEDGQVVKLVVSR